MDEHNEVMQDETMTDSGKEQVTQARWKSATMWASIAALVLAVLVAGNVINVSQSELIQSAIAGILSALAGFGVVNNPTNKAGL